MIPVVSWGTFPEDGGCRCEYGVQGTSWISCDRGIQGKGMCVGLRFQVENSSAGEHQQDKSEPLPLFPLLTSSTILVDPAGTPNHVYGRIRLGQEEGK